MKKSLAYLSLALASVLCACTTNKGTTQAVVYDEMGYPLASKNRLHDVTIKQSTSRTITKEENGVLTAEYQIIYNDQGDALIERSANFIAQYLSKALNVSFLPTAYSEYFDSVSYTTKAIIIGCDDLFTAAGFSMPTDVDLDISGYVIKSSYNIKPDGKKAEGNTVYIMGNTKDGYQPAAIQFLRYVVGFDYISEDIFTFEKTENVKMPFFDVVERPDYQIQTANNKINSTDNYALGFSTHYPFPFTRTIIDRETGNTIPEKDGRNWHNIGELVSFGAENRSAHPDWFAEESLGVGNMTLCYCCNDKPEELDALCDEIMKGLKRTYEAHPETNILLVTHEDNAGACQCSFCKAHEGEDGSIAGTQIRFMNALDKKFQAYLEEYKVAHNLSEKPLVYLQFFAYSNFQASPTRSVEEDPTLKCSPTVMVCCALIHAKFTHPYYDEINADNARNFINWSNYCDNVTTWIYETSYNHEFFPYNTYSSAILTYRFMQENNAKIMISEGQRSNARVTAFGKFKDYIASKAGFDVNVSYETLYNKFFNSWFKDGAPYMQEFFNEMVAWETYLEQNVQTTGVGQECYNKIGSDARNWPKQLLLNWLEDCDNARSAVAKYQATDPILYSVLMKNILVETIFPRWALITLHENTYIKSELDEMRRQFKEDCASLGIVKYAHEAYETLESKYLEWGI